MIILFAYCFFYYHIFIVSSRNIILTIITQKLLQTVKLVWTACSDPLLPLVGANRVANLASRCPDGLVAAPAELHSDAMRWPGELWTTGSDPWEREGPSRATQWSCPSSAIFFSWSEYAVDGRFSQKAFNAYKVPVRVCLWECACVFVCLHTSNRWGWRHPDG